MRPTIVNAMVVRISMVTMSSAAKTSDAANNMIVRKITLSSNFSLSAST